MSENIVYLNRYTKIIDKTFINTKAQSVFMGAMNKQMSFEGVSISKAFAKVVAKLINFFNITPIGLAHPNDIYIYTSLAMLKEPDLQFNDWVKIFARRFAPGTVFVIDYLFDEKKEVGSHIFIGRVESIIGRHVRVRKYHSSVINPPVFKANGGVDGTRNYVFENFLLTDIHRHDPFFRFPINKQEQDVINILFYQ